MESKRIPRKLVIYAWFMVALGATFYLYEYILRVAPSVMTDELMRDFKIDAASLGNLAAFFYYVYTPMQLVVGVLMDRYGPRRLFILASFVCALGTYLFACSNNFILAAFGRLLIGFASAFGFVGIMKLATIWLPPQRFALAAGIATTLGTGGAIIGNLLLTSLVNTIGWRPASYSTAIAGIGIGIIFILALKDSGKFHGRRLNSTNEEIEEINFPQVWQGLFVLLRSWQIWLVGIISCLMYLPITAFAELWANPYLQQTHHLSSHKAATMISILFAGWALGGPILGAISDHFERRCLPMLFGVLISLLCITVLIYVPNLHEWLILVLLFLFGFSLSAQVIVFAVAREISTYHSAGTAIALTNMLTMIGGVLFQPLIGKMLDVNWTGGIVEGTRFYSVKDYQIALTVLPLALLLSLILIYFLRETHGRLSSS